MSIECKRIKSSQTHSLRQKILRPHQSIKEMIYPRDDEKSSYHVGAFEEGELIGIASMYHESQGGTFLDGDWRIRGMAIDQGNQKKGVGRMLVQSCIEHARASDGKSIWCNARSTAIGFYLSLGFKQVGDEFNIEGIGPHYIAERVL